MKPEESALGNALLSLTLWLSDVYAAAIEAYRVTGELNPGNMSFTSGSEKIQIRPFLSQLFRSKTSGRKDYQRNGKNYEPTIPNGSNFRCKASRCRYYVEN